METQGNLKDIGISLQSRRTVVTLEVTAAPENVEQYMNMNLDVTIVKHKEKRSLNANAYFWVLVNKIAQAAGISDTMVHDRLLAENRAYVITDGVMEWRVSGERPSVYGIIKDGERYYIDSGMAVTMNKPSGDLLMQKDGNAAIGNVFWRIKGSREMDTTEMSRLIDSTVQEAQSLHIETMTPQQIKVLVDMWGETQRKQAVEKLETAQTEQQRLPL